MPAFLHIGCDGKRKDQTMRGFRKPKWQELLFNIDSGQADHSFLEASLRFPRPKELWPLVNEASLFYKFLRSRLVKLGQRRWRRKDAA